MSRKKQAPKQIFYPDTKYGSLILAKFINFVMYDGKKTTSEKLIYDALEKIKNKTKNDPIKIFNEAIANIRPNLEVRSRRVGGATYQVPQEVQCPTSYLMNLWMLHKIKVQLLKKEKIHIRWQSQTKLLHITGGNNV